MTGGPSAVAYSSLNGLNGGFADGTWDTEQTRRGDSITKPTTLAQSDVLNAYDKDEGKNPNNPPASTWRGPLTMEL